MVRRCIRAIVRRASLPVHRAARFPTVQGMWQLPCVPGRRRVRGLQALMNAPQLPTKELPTEVDGEYQLAVDFDNIDNEEWLREVELQKRWAENERIAREKWRGDEG